MGINHDFLGGNYLKEKKFGIKEIWLLDEKGNKVMKLTGCHFDTPPDNPNPSETVYENGVYVIKLKDQ